MLANRALEAAVSGFDVNGTPSRSKDLGVPMLRFPQLQNREMLPMIILPRSDVVIKMAL